MKKGYKFTIISICVVLLILSVLLLFGTIYIVDFSDKNIDYAYDEMLFEISKGSTVTEYYANTFLGNEYEFEKLESIVLGDKKKLWVSLENVNDYLINGFISVEDKRFYSHSGVDLKRTLYALSNSIFHFKSTFGASTITQQVIKNISGDNEITLKRKLSEIIRAYNIENNHTKDEILELYINIIPMGENLYGVRSASETYFGKSPMELTLAEAATIVGITNAPTRYNPHKNPDECQKKRNDVLFCMYSSSVISEEEYSNAINEPLNILPVCEEYDEAKSWFIETVNNDVISAICEKYKISYSAAQTLLYNGGFRIYTTQNPIVQKELEAYFEDKNNFPAEVNKGLDYSMVICDSLNGNLLGIVGSVGKKQADKLLNLALTPHTPGSSLKPIALYAPLINSGRINWSTVFDDVPVEFIKSGGRYIEYPQNYPRVYDGLTNIKDALRVSKNTVAVRLYEMLGAEEIYRSLKYDFGFDTLVRHSNTGSTSLTDLASSPLALGQLSYGVSLRKLTEAYTVFPSDGVLTQGRSFIYVYDKNGNLIIDNLPEEKRIFSKECSRIMNQLLMNVTSNGTASAVTLKYNIDTAGKTGTSGDDKDRIFVGYTPYLTAGIWCGYRDSDQAIGNLSVTHVKIWDNVMKSIHKKLLSGINDEDIKSFSLSGLKRYEYCKDSGKLYSPNCMKDPRGVRLDIGYFTNDNKPEGLCEVHILCKYDFLTEAIATDGCPEEYLSEVSLLKINTRHFPKEIIITDADYVYYEIDGSLPLGDDYNVPYFENYIEEGIYIGRGRRKKQFNSSCYLHND